MKRILKFASLDDRDLAIAEAAYTLALAQFVRRVPEQKEFVEVVLAGEAVDPKFSLVNQLERTLTDQTLLDKQKEQYEAA